MTLHPEASKQAKHKFERLLVDFKSVHGDKYDYSEVEYLKSTVKVLIKCNECNYKFLQYTNSHKAGQGCPRCAIKNNTDLCRKTQDTFIQELLSIYGNTYDYSKVHYTLGSNKVQLHCNIHNIDFEGFPSNLLRGSGCPKCGKDKFKISKTLPFLEFVKRAEAIHGKSKYNYLEATYINGGTKMDIYCNRHHYVFSQRPTAHLQGQGCPRCGDINSRKQYLDKPTTLYYIKILHKDNTYFKIGITSNNITDRFKRLSKDYKIEVINTKMFSLGEIAYITEQRIINDNLKHLTKDPVLIGNGNSEVFNKDIYSDIQHYFI